MSLKAGIVGLPNVGKSTLFNAITNSQVEAANYPFATINPNTGVVEVEDKRMDFIVSVCKPQKIIPTTFEFTDIAGLVKGASKGEGLGNMFLAHIREVDAICHVVRCFSNDDIIHVEGSIDSVRDVETINFELIFADIDSIEKRLPKILKKAQTNKDKDLILEASVLEKILITLKKGERAIMTELDDGEREVAKKLQLITYKPVIYVANLSESEITNPDQNSNYQQLLAFAKNENAKVVAICAQIEADLVTLNKEERATFLQELGIEQSGLSILTNQVYNILNLATFFTAGVKEVRAWTFINGMKAPKCAGIIHSDFERGFIKAEVYNFTDLQKFGNEQLVKEKGKFRIEGKEYVMQDGDIVHFRFNV